MIGAVLGGGAGLVGSFLYGVDGPDGQGAEPPNGNVVNRRGEDAEMFVDGSEVETDAGGD